VAHLPLPPVSVLIAVKNGADFLEKNIPRILQQDYPDFEIVIVDDHSDDPEKEKLKRIAATDPRIRLVHSDRLPGKKKAITSGVEMASHDIILCTDADCYPVTADWIRQMTVSHHDGNMVLGYSPYEKKKGLLNFLVRFETLMTGMQYLSWTMHGLPYMGVGRNLMYSKSVFRKINPYRQNQHIPYGDDDLLVQSMLDKKKITFCMEPASFVRSDPPVKWTDWISQKHRHLSAAHQYRFSTWWQPAVFGMALIGHWLLVIPVMGSSLWKMALMPGALVLVIRWLSFIRWSQRLGDKDLQMWYPVLEIAYTFYLALVGMVTAFRKKKTWK
jgi:glycosyltransferase involved in cell wall biosynthesis